MSLPSIQTLRAFDAAARHGSYTAAAEELGVTHGAVSHRIRELEGRLGAPLFRRSGRLMVPTREAVALLSQVRQALAMLQRAFPAPPGRTRERLTVSAHPSLAGAWLAPNLGAFTTRHPNVDLEIRSTADLEDFLDAGVDVALRYGAGSWPNANDELLAGESLFPVCSPDYRASMAIAEPGDLARCVLLRHTWQAWAPWFREAGLRLAEPEAGLRLSDSSLALAAAASGQGVALARGLLARRDLADGRLVKLFDAEIQDVYGYFLSWRVGVRLTAAAEAFRSWARSELQANASAGPGR